MELVFRPLYHNTLELLANLDISSSNYDKINDTIHILKECEIDLHLEKCVADKMFVALKNRKYKKIIRLAIKTIIENN